ncbi:serine/threonine-protein kinase par-1-like isoform X2 [Gigantopelta aegis]|nr:serine/threonine-protein kinase par-1-like isoform X2 [Gigantopelta aegis]
MHQEYRLSEDKSRIYVRQLVSALHYLHERGVAHRDLKMENIMLDEKRKNIKLCDFGLSNTFSDQELMKTHCGSPEYAAPELFSAGEKYGKEIDIWSLGVVMYAMMVGKLPFTTPYTDQYRRIKLLQQIEKGLVDEHHKEMAHLSLDARDLIQKIIEPSPAQRLPLMDIEIHPWLTAGSKMPFYPFVALPRDKAMKSVVITEVATLMTIKKDVVEQTVHENKFDELSAMYNMILDKKRLAQGIFNVDHTLKCEHRNEGKAPRKHRSKSTPRTDNDSDAKSKTKTGKVPPALVLTANITVESAPHSATGLGTAPQEYVSTTSTNFDFLALCSQPTWLGVDRRRSRRRSRSPGPMSPAAHSGSMKKKRDKEKEKHSHSQEGAGALLSPGNVGSTEAVESHSDAMKGEDSHFLSPNVVHSSNLTLLVPQSKPHGLQRVSSLRLSKKRSKSCGPRGKGPLQRSSSADVPDASHVIEPIVPITLEVPKQSPIPRPANLVLKECLTSASSVKLKALTAGTNGPITSVDVHFSDSSNPCSSTDLVKGSENSTSLLTNRLDVPQAELNLCKNLPNKNVLRTTNLSVHSRSAGGGGGPQSTASVSGGSLSVVKPKDDQVSECVSVDVFHEKAAKPSLSMNNTVDHQSTLGARAMQFEECTDHDKTNSLWTEKESSGLHDNRKGRISSEVRKLEKLDLRIPLQESFSGKDVFSDHYSGLESAGCEKIIAQELDDLKLLEMEECEDLVDGIADSVSENGDETTALIQTSKNLKLSSPGCLKPSARRNGHETQVTLDEIEVLDLVDQTDMASCSSQSAKRPNSVGSSKSAKKGSGGSRSSSTRSQKYLTGPKLKTPTTPTWMVLKTPIARIESFHSDEFEYYTSEPDRGDRNSLNSMSPLSVNTPTVPCFAYKLNLGKKKPPKLKKTKSKMDSLSKSTEVVKSLSQERNAHGRLEPVLTDPLLSSGSETEHHDELYDKVTGTGKSKIHPMDMDDQDTEVLSKSSKVSRAGNNQKVSHTNSITKQPNQIQNSVNRHSKNFPSHDTKKKISVKGSPWRKSFAQFLKRKRLNYRLTSNNNNNDCSTATQEQSTRNGHAPSSPVSKTTEPPGPEENRLTSSSGLVGNNITDVIELQSSPLLHSPSPTHRVFDFTLVTDSPKGKSCLLSWRACRDCGISDQSSEEGSECNIPLETDVNLSLKALSDLNNIQDPTRTFTAYQFTQT